jgi:hypothetical protein
LYAVLLTILLLLVLSSRNFAKILLLVAFSLGSFVLLLAAVIVLLALLHLLTPPLRLLFVRWSPQPGRVSVPGRDPPVTMMTSLLVVNMMTPTLWTSIQPAPQMQMIIRIFSRPAGRLAISFW